MEKNEYTALATMVKRETGAYAVRVHDGLVEYLVAIGSAKVPSWTDIWHIWGYVETVGGSLTAKRKGER